MRFVCIAGLPGSGKTYVGSLVSMAKGWPFVDDLFRDSDMVVLVRLIDSGEHDTVIISAPHFCMEGIREMVNGGLKGLTKDPIVDWYFFENDPDACRKNVESRNDGRDVWPTLENMAQSYTIPRNRPTFGVNDPELFNRFVCALRADEESRESQRFSSEAGKC